MNILAKLMNGLNKKDKEMTVEKAIKIFKNNKEKYAEFEKFYQDNVLNEISDNYFNINSRQAKTQGLGAFAVDNNLVDRIVDEFVNGTHIIEVKNNKVIDKILEKEHKSINTVEELQELDVNKQVQFTKKLSKYDIPTSDSFNVIVGFAKFGKYNMFRGALESLDISPVIYKILQNNKNTMGYWLPKVAEISPFKIPDTKIVEVPLSMLQLGRVFDYGQLTQTSFDVINKYCMEVFDLDVNKSYFIKNGVYSSKYDFRNAKVTTPNEVRELGQYLFYIHQQACNMSSLLNNISVFGAGTTVEWVVREYIESPETETIYKGLPLNTEYRIFVDFDKKSILADANYWDKDVMNKRFAENRDNHDVHDVVSYNMAVDRLEKTYTENINKVKELVQEMLNNNVEMTGQWSLDIMQTGNEFYLIDMALAENSFYYDRVPKELRCPTPENWLELQ